MNPSIAYSQRTNNYHVINQVQVSSKKIKIAYDIVKDGQGKMSAVIDADFTLPLGKTSVGIRTPQKQEPIDSEVDIDEKYFFFPSTVDQLRLVQDEAEKFILGERAQGQLFSNDKK